MYLTIAISGGIHPVQRLNLAACQRVLFLFLASMSKAMKWYEPQAENSPWIKTLADVRHMGTREGYCFEHVQAIMLSIDQYAETALGNRHFFLNKPYGVGGKNDKIP